MHKQKHSSPDVAEVPTPQSNNVKASEDIFPGATKLVPLLRQTKNDCTPFAMQNIIAFFLERQKTRIQIKIIKKFVSKPMGY